MIGTMRNRIELLTRTRTSDNAGGASETWGAGHEIWAGVTRLTSTRDFIGERTRRLKRISALIRHRADIALGQQLNFDGVRYEVVSIESDGPRANHLTLICEEAVS